MPDASPRRPHLRRLVDTDPIRYANRPLEPGFDAYQAVREHVEKLVVPTTLPTAERSR